MMLGTFSLDGKIPAEPEIVLTNCTDTAMLGNLVSMFQGNPDIRFFLVEGAEEAGIDLNADLYFLKDSGNWVLASHNTMVGVRFDDASFNPTGTEGIFSINQADDGTWSISADEAQVAHMPPSDQLLVDMAEDDIFGADADIAPTGTDADTFFIDPSVLAQGENEIVLTNFHLGTDSLELPEGMSIKDVIVDTEQDLAEVVIGQTDTAGDDIVVKLLGVAQSDLPTHEYGLESDSANDDIISHMINSGINAE